jgi:hypothetical protein
VRHKIAALTNLWRRATGMLRSCSWSATHPRTDENHIPLPDQGKLGRGVSERSIFIIEHQGPAQSSGNITMIMLPPGTLDNYSGIKPLPAIASAWHLQNVEKDEDLAVTAGRLFDLAKARASCLYVVSSLAFIASSGCPVPLPLDCGRGEMRMTAQERAGVKAL